MQTFELNKEYNIEFKEFNSHINLAFTIDYKSTSETYDLTYKWKIISGNSNIHKNIVNPFLNNQVNYDESDLEGIIIKKNKMTTEMINFFTMDESLLKEKIGMGTALDYKIRIINTLALFFD